MYNIYVKNIIAFMWNAHIYVNSYDKFERKWSYSLPSISFVAGGTSVGFSQTPIQLRQDSS